MKYAYAHTAKITNGSIQQTRTNAFAKSIFGLKRIDYILGGLVLAYGCGLFL